MAGVTGREVAMAFAKFGANSWGVAASVTKGIYFSNDGGLKLEPNIVEDDAFGQTFIAQADVGNITPPDLSLPKQARYHDDSFLWEALAMGSPAAVTISSSAAGEDTSWLHVIDLAKDIDGLGLTLAIDKVQYVQELTSAKVRGWDIEDDGAMVKQTFKLTGSKPTIISSTNINSTVGGATFPSLANRLLKKQGVFRMNENSTAALAASDKVLNAETVKFGFERPQDAPHVYGQDYVIEPADNDFPTFAIEVMYSRMDNASANSLEIGLKDSTAFKADWTFSGAFINSTDTHQVLYQFPYLQLTDFEATVEGANQIKPKAIFAARLAPTSPTGMSFVNPFRLTRIHVNSVVAF